MALDDKSDKSDKKTPISPTDVIDDPADAFKRVDPNDPTAQSAADFKETSRKDRKKRRAERGDTPRQPNVESASAKKPADDDEGMDPLDAAAEIIGLADNLFAMTASFRHYDKVQLPDGTAMLPLVIPKEEDKERLRKALARVMKSSGATLSPGAALALGAFFCYGAPIIGMEMALASARKAPKS